MATTGTSSSTISESTESNQSTSASVAVSTSTSAELIDLEGREDRSEECSSATVSLLSRLKAPTEADIARQRKLKKNPPPIGKRHSRGTSVSDPKGIEPHKRVQEFPKEALKVSAGKLFCTACREELGLKRSTIMNHIRSKKHESSKKKLEKKELREKDIADSLVSYNAKEHLSGETLPEQQQVYRVKVVMAFLRAGVPLSKLDCFRDLLEENGYRLIDRRHTFDLVPFVQKEEESSIRKELTGNYLSVIFDGTSRLGEALAIVVRYVDDNFKIEQRLIRMQMLSKSMTGEEIARELINQLSAVYGIQSEFLLAAMIDRAAVNNVAMQTLKVVYPSLFDIGCFSHTLDRVGEKFNTPALTEFMHSWLSMFSHSPKARLLWKSKAGCSMPSYSATRWWSKWEVIKMVMVYFGDVLPFLQQNDDIAPNTRAKLLSILNDAQSKCQLLLEMAATVDWGEPFVKACYTLEGDGPLALECSEVMEKVSATLHVGHIPNVHAIAQQLSGVALSSPQCQQLVAYAKSCIQPGLDYYELQLRNSLKSPLAAFKCASLFSPEKVNRLKPDATVLQEYLSAVPFLNAQDIVSSLASELPDYLALAANTSKDFPALDWWKDNASTLPHWSKCAKKIFLLQPLSAAAERVFSLLNSSFGERQDNALKDYIEASLMLQYNKR